MKEKTKAVLLSVPHIIFEKTDVFSAEGAVGQGLHFAEIKRRQPDPGPLSAKPDSKCITKYFFLILKLLLDLHDG